MERFSLGKAESYTTSILDDFEYSLASWVDWNLRFDLIRSPNWAKKSSRCFHRQRDKQVSNKQLLYYSLVCFTEFIPKGLINERIRILKSVEYKEALVLDLNIKVF